MEEFCVEKGILHEFRAPYTPQQNGVAERKNRTLIEAARSMLADSKLPLPEEPSDEELVNLFQQYLSSSHQQVPRPMVVTEDHPEGAHDSEAGPTNTQNDSQTQTIETDASAENVPAIVVEITNDSDSDSPTFDQGDTDS
ncbi:uncharacterized protein LOC110888019 [Helianthus annuus]|uniref:uncharacterized protein LOC110888019 n=1 Tax=Helianthus annuus TaxID=4232 RepID=UPI000B908E3B|nr:uncharacterized protein LOC110888019 [Helianthus annuus]